MTWHPMTNELKYSASQFMSAYLHITYLCGRCAVAMLAAGGVGRAGSEGVREANIWYGVLHFSGYYNECCVLVR